MKKLINILFNDFTSDNRVFKESVSLFKNGFDVELVATRFDRNLPVNENIQGIRIRRVSVGGFKFLPINLILFWLNVIKLYRKERLFHCNDLYALPPAFVVKRLFNRDTKIIYDCHEHETEAGIYVGNPVLKFFAKIFEKIMIKSADKVITVSESIANDYVSMYGIEKPLLVMNCPRYRTYERFDLFRKELKIPGDKIIILYQGEYLKGRGVENLVEVFQKLETLNKKIVLVLLTYGDDIEDLKKIIKNSKNIYWHDRVSVLEYMNYVASADWGILLLENTCKNSDFSLANKFFDYIAGDLPVIVSDLKEMSDFIGKYRIGYVVDPQNIEEIVNLLKDFDKDTKKEFLLNLKSVAKKYCWEEQEKVLFEIYKEFRS